MSLCCLKECLFCGLYFIDLVSSLVPAAITLQTALHHIHFIYNASEKS